MEFITITQLNKAQHLLKTTPSAAHFEKIIKQDTTLVYNGNPIAVYLTLPREAVTELRRVAQGTQYKSSDRTWGLPTQSTVFGALPRHSARNDYCRFTNSSRTEPAHLETSFKFAQVINDIYKKYLPVAQEFNNRAIDEAIHKDWRINETPFTTCNFNINHAIKYHQDRGNFKDVFSNVLILRSGITGGELVFPEFGLAFEQQDCALGIFDGQHWVHGVMPITRQRKNAYRASIVFYALAGMKSCYPYKEEIERFKTVRTKQEKERSIGNPELRRQTKNRSN